MNTGRWTAQQRWSKLGYLKYKRLKIPRYICDSENILNRFFTKKCGFSIHKNTNNNKKSEKLWTDPTKGGCDHLYFVFWEMRKNSLSCTWFANIILQQRPSQGLACSLPVLSLAQRISLIRNQRLFFFLAPMFVSCLPVTVCGWCMAVSSTPTYIAWLQLKKFRSYFSGLSSGEKVTQCDKIQKDMSYMTIE